TTGTKIELLLRSQAGSTVVEFLKAKAGYITGDSTDQLAKSLAGVNFLVLAAALLSVTETFEAARALENMITASAADKTLTPTTYHLKDLLDVLEPRLNRAGFMDEVLRWKAWWMELPRLGDAERLHVLENGETLPSSDGLEKIVSALRAAYRVGQAAKVTLTTRSAAPWLTAFLTRCIGTCPIIYGHDGHVLYCEQDTPFKIVCSNDQWFDTEIKIEITNEYESFDEILAANLVDSRENLIRSAAGMTRVGTYGKHVLSSLSFGSKLANRAFLCALPYALLEGRNKPVDYARRNFNLLDFEGLPLKALLCNPFPQESVIAEVTKEYLSLDVAPDLKQLPEKTLISDLPLVRIWLETLSLATSKAFEEDMSVVVADILVLSLFRGCPDTLLVYYSPLWHKEWRRNNRGTFSHRIADALLGKKRSSILWSDIIA
ncbi:MAG: hypothetical protein MMC33_010385, partial [Icmadophila ericetorum]|nr:hypothetical protein [Icmadophila ericetorum]